MDGSAEDTKLFTLISRVQWSGSREGITCRRKGVSNTLLERTVLRPACCFAQAKRIPVLSFRSGIGAVLRDTSFAGSTFCGQVTKHILWGGHPAFRAYCAAKQGEHCM